MNVTFEALKEGLNKDPEYLKNQLGLITFKQLKAELVQLNGSEFPDRTVYYWIRAMGIQKNKFGFYSQEDLDMLSSWLSLRSGFKSIEAFLVCYDQMMNNLNTIEV